MTSRSDALADKRVLVVGGRGFVGAHVVRALLRAGAQVHVLGPAMEADRSGALPAGVGETVGSVTDPQVLADALDAFAATEIVSCAGYGAGHLGLMRSGEADRDAAMTVNVLGQGRLLEAARNAGIRLVVWTSSTVVYGQAALYGKERVDETAPRAPETFYGVTKSLAEELSAFYSRRREIGVVALRLPLVLGPGLWYAGAAAALADLFAAAGRREAHRLAFHDEPIDLMHVADVADAVLTVLRHRGPLAETYNLEGFTARASELLADVQELAPSVDVGFENAGRPPLLFPLISGERLRRDTGFLARHDRAAFVRAMLSGETTE